VDAQKVAIALSSANARRHRALASGGPASLQQQQERAQRFDADAAARRRDVAAQVDSRQEVGILEAQLQAADAAVGLAQAAPRRGAAAPELYAHRRACGRRRRAALGSGGQL
jgi:hypothetical protein